MPAAYTPFALALSRCCRIGDPTSYGTGRGTGFRASDYGARTPSPSLNLPEGDSKLLSLSSSCKINLSRLPARSITGRVFERQVYSLEYFMGFKVVLVQIKIGDLERPIFRMPSFPILRG